MDGRLVASTATTPGKMTAYAVFLSAWLAQLYVVLGTAVEGRGLTEGRLLRASSVVDFSLSTGSGDMTLLQTSGPPAGVVESKEEALVERQRNEIAHLKVTCDASVAAVTTQSWDTPQQLAAI